MDLSISMRALKNVFTFPFADPDWKNKLLIGSGLTFAGFLIPILPTLFVTGYAARVLRAGAANEDAGHLPQWDDWGDLFMDGLRLFGTILIFTLPAMLVGFAGWFIYMLATVSMSFPGRASSMDPSQALTMLLAFIVFFIGMGGATLLGMGGFLVMPPAVAHVAVTRRFGALFEIGEWWRVLRANFGGFLIAIALFLLAYGMTMLAFQILYFTVVLCFLAPLLMAPLGFYSVLIFTRLSGQAYGEAAPHEGLSMPSAAGAEPA